MTSEEERIELIDEVAAIIDPVWFAPTFLMEWGGSIGEIQTHPFDNFPHQHVKYQEDAYAKAELIIRLVEREDKISIREVAQKFKKQSLG